MPQQDNPGTVGGNKKYFVPLENNPDVFTHLVHDLGVSPSLGFYDVYSIDEPALLALIPRPAYALIFISPAEVWHKRHASDLSVGISNERDLPAYTGSGSDEPVIWFKQTIGNACGLIALLHSISNGAASSYILPDTTIDGLVRDAIPLKQKERADLLYNSQELERAHQAAAQKGDTLAPDSRERVGFHFISFVKGRDGHLWELEGGLNGPVDRGRLAEEDDMLSTKALDLGIRPFLKAAEGGTGINGALGFSIVALAPR
ncbi:hypothetical protein H2203_003063 [Taxawa tesnikishii (nom. ined.)]|nr:hypothetical protein H2203_003063 [Dothideales sp. JES 119]